MCLNILLFPPIDGAGMAEQKKTRQANPYKAEVVVVPTIPLGGGGDDEPVEHHEVSEDHKAS